MLGYVRRFVQLSLGLPTRLVEPDRSTVGGVRHGVEAEVKNGVRHSQRYDQMRDPLDGQMKYRCLYEKDGADVPFVLVNDPDNGDGRVIPLDSVPASAP